MASSKQMESPRLASSPPNRPLSPLTLASPRFLLPSVGQGSVSAEESDRLIGLLKNGVRFLKFGRSGKPHLTAVKLSDDLLSIVWSNGSKSARTSTIVDVLSGRKTKVWAIHFPNKDKEQSQQSSAAANDTHNNSNNNNSVDSFCFSIVFTDRTLDLQIDNSTLHSDAAPSTAINALNTAMQARDDYVRAFKWAHDFGCKLSAGLPMNVKKVLHVNRAMEWSGQNLEEVFELKEKLGEGAFGSVYRVVHRSAKIEMAVKLIPASNPEAMNDIKKEIEILQSCRNQYIVGYYGCWGPDSQNRLWILMDYCAVGSMVTLLHLTKAVLTEAQIAFIMHSTLTALVYLQSQQIIHRDVKGRNILVTADGDIKLADFGVSKSIKDDNGLTSSGICGSPLFMAPEVCTNKPTSFASDIWSLGITAIEIAEGRVPYDEMNSALRIMRAITNNPPPNLTQQSWSPSFRNFVSACLVKDPAKRPDAIKMLSDPFVANVKSTAHSKFVLRPLLDRFFELKAKKNASNNAAAAVAAVLAVAAAPYTAAANANALAPSAANPAPEKEKEKGKMVSQLRTLFDPPTPQDSTKVPVPHKVAAAVIAAGQMVAGAVAVGSGGRVSRVITSPITIPAADSKSAFSPAQLPPAPHLDTSVKSDEGSDSVVDASVVGVEPANLHDSQSTVRSPPPVPPRPPSPAVLLERRGSGVNATFAAAAAAAANNNGSGSTKPIVMGTALQRRGSGAGMTGPPPRPPRPPSRHGSFSHPPIPALANLTPTAAAAALAAATNAVTSPTPSFSAGRNSPSTIVLSPSPQHAIPTFDFSTSPPPPHPPSRPALSGANPSAFSPPTATGAVGSSPPAASLNGKPTPSAAVAAAPAARTPRNSIGVFRRVPSGHSLVTLGAAPSASTASAPLSSVAPVLSVDESPGKMKHGKPIASLAAPAAAPSPSPIISPSSFSASGGGVDAYHKLFQLHPPFINARIVLLTWIIAMLAVLVWWVFGESSPPPPPPEPSIAISDLPLFSWFSSSTPRAAAPAATAPVDEPLPAHSFYY